MFLAHKTRLRPTNDQISYFKRACGVRRFAYNWALERWRKYEAEGVRVNSYSLRRELNQVKRERFPWMLEVSKCVPQHAIDYLGRAYYGFNAGRTGAPRYKKKTQNESFRIDTGAQQDRRDAIAVCGRRVFIPKLGWVAMCEEMRFEGRILNATISYAAGKWYIAFGLDLQYECDKHLNPDIVGIDLGIQWSATISDGSVRLVLPRPLKTYAAREKRLCRVLSRKKKGSKNRAKARTKLSRFYHKMANIRRDAVHKFTTALMVYGTIAIEDIYVAGLKRNRRVSRVLSDSAFGEFKRQLLYKSAMSGTKVVLVDRWFASSKICSQCGRRNDKLSLAVRLWTCDGCGTTLDRDVNAAVNLKNYAASPAALASGGAAIG